MSPRHSRLLGEGSHAQSECDYDDAPLSSRRWDRAGRYILPPPLVEYSIATGDILAIFHDDIYFGRTARHRLVTIIADYFFYSLYGPYLPSSRLRRARYYATAITLHYWGLVIYYINFSRQHIWEKFSWCLSIICYKIISRKVSLC